MPDLESKIAFRNTAPDYARALQWAHHLVYSAARIENMEAGLLAKVPELTWHSARVAMLDQAVHFGRTPQEIGVQANWKDPGPLVLKYTRSRSSLPARMIKQLVAEISQAHLPACAREDDEIEDNEDTDLSITEFFVKASEKGSSYEYKFHVCSSENADEIACGMVKTEDCAHIGAVLPDAAPFKTCAKARPDVALAYKC